MFSIFYEPIKSFYVYSSNLSSEIVNSSEPKEKNVIISIKYCSTSARFRER